MNKRILVVTAATLVLGSCATPEPEKQEEVSMMKLSYPDTRMEEVSDTLWGTTVKDPYRWLEDDNAPEVKDWVQAQNGVTRSFLDSIPYRDAIRDRYEQLFNYEKVGSPFRVGDNYFISKNDGLQNQSVIYVRKGKEGEEEVFLDPNKLSDDGTVTASLMGASDDDKYMALTRNEAGSDWGEIRVMDIATKKETGDVLKWVKFSGASWYEDGFFYSRYPAPEEGDELSAENTFHKIYYHKLGTDQSEDRLIYMNEDAPNMYHWANATEDKKYLVLYASTGTDGYECHYMALDNQEAGFTPLFTGFENKSSVIEHIDGKFVVMTDIGAPKYRLVAIDPANPDESNWVELLPETDHLLESVSTAGGKFFATYLENANSKVYKLDYDGANKVAINLPDATGSAYGFGGEEEDETVFYMFTSFTYPSTIFEMNIASGESELYYAPELEFDPADFESKEIFYKSKDGTEVSLFIVHKKGLTLDGTNPTMLYGYGGFNVSLTPSFSTSNIILLENGGVYAMANLRGGGEYGEEWHKAGMLTKKQNVFDDFIAAGEYLIAEGYTSSERLAIAGGSNGGLLVGACMAQRPDLFQVAFPAVGVMDMLRYHKFTVGWGWIPEYGCADSSKVDFDNLYGYSPLHNLTDGTAYPATMVTTADHDDRVVPAHSFKFAARLQAAHSGDAPVVIRIEEKAGHGAGKPTSKVIDEQADKWAFMFMNMGVIPNY
ncbi:MAG: prolyl oligopeptidase family serine peptidase [Flavobacteriales bacterium]|nr:prolyl oligopeptidase family serine peptidase [Flavobacteriales bacterium]MDG2246646.1 prolyl oligopeptidase family serine peptidase [Flavobacteriales bacterium]